MSKIHFISLGCPRNLVDSEVMLGIVLQAGHEIAERVEDADFLVVNTCGFLEASRQEALATLEKLINNKKPQAKVIVAGCMVKDHQKKLFPDEVHYFLGSGDAESILEAITSEERGEKIGSVKSYLEAGEIPRTLSTPPHYAYLKIAEGCRKGCAYCSIPKIKGPLRSKPPEQILKEFRALLARGVQEIILIAQDLGDYGKDINTSLTSLLRELLKVEGNYWLRLLYLYPDEITDELIELIKNNPRICPYLDMPIQHINNDILKAMRRHTTGEEIKQVISRLRDQIPHIHIRTSLIVGFPGETQAHFNQLVDFIQKHPLNHVGIFTYSREEGTTAAKMDNQLPESVKKKREQRLAAVQKKIVHKLGKKMVGQEMDVVIEGYHPESKLLMIGRHSGQCPEIDGQVIINDGEKVTAFGQRYRVKITDVAGYDLVGIVLSKLKSKLPLPLLK
ncbi:MAG: Ribosomal protein S12 methylthiotransferase RimO [Chlamydiae bacterium]|nr:Ribosomal protein S12 methylthiotransferase RimO [Chlamydiota bacterium]